MIGKNCIKGTKSYTEILLRRRFHRSKLKEMASNSDSIGDNDAPASAPASASIEPQKIYEIQLTIEQLKEIYRKDGEMKFIKKSTNSRKKIQSIVWNKFSLIEVKHNNDFVRVSNFVVCIACVNFYKYNGATTSNLNSHRCIGKDSQQTEMTDYSVGARVVGTINKVKFSVEDKNHVRDSAVKFIVNDLRPFYAIQGTGLKTLIQSILNISQKYPHVESDDIMQILPGRMTVRNHVIDAAKKTVEKIKLEFKKVLEFPGEFTIAVDLWKDAYRGVTYAGIVAHYNLLSDDKIERKSVVCSVTQIKELTKTNVHIRRTILEIFEKNFGIPEEIFAEKVKGISDRGKNVAMALATGGNIVLHCYCHLLNNLVENMCKFECVKTIISNASTLVNLMKTSGMNSRLKTTLKSNVVTRWNSVYYMLNSINVNYDQLLEILTQKERETMKYIYVAKLSCLDRTEIIDLITFLKEFEKWSVALESEKEITLHKVWPTYCKMCKLLEKSATDSAIIIGMKELGTKYIEKNRKDFEPHYEHKLACFLHPLLKHLQFTTLDDRIDTQTYAEKRLETYIEIVQGQEQNVEQPVRAHTHGEDDLFVDFIDKNTDAAFSNIHQEIHNYLMFNVSWVSRSKLQK